jgi:hypothetical protein
MDENENRGRRGRTGAEDIEPLDLARPVGAAQRRPDADPGSLLLAQRSRSCWMLG